MSKHAVKLTVAFVACGCLLSVAAPRGAQQPARVAPVAPTSAPRTIDYNWDVRPILSDNCFRCHGPDERARRVGLRLDQVESALARRPGGPQARFAIVPGRPDDSEVIKRITHANVAMRMPPVAANKTLSSEQIETLRQWIAQGAQYKPHWAYLTPAKPAVPQIPASSRASTNIDRFILSRLQRERLRPSPEADRETLINRVTLTLTGLPPALGEVDAFVKDVAPNAYEKLVDRLLASPAYGERMAAYWLDVARYSESDGFLDDLHDRLLWPYRDWVIAAFNRNMPFDQFSTWQIAGDLLPSPSKEQVLATAFLRLGKRTTENGAIDEEYRVEYTIDRANTIGTGFLGLTTGCARCHDHKYDPISQKDFYSLTAFFNSNDEPGYYAPGSSGVTAGPTLTWTDPATEEKLAHAHAAVRAQEAAYSALHASAERDAAARVEPLMADANALKAELKQSIESGLVAHYAFEETQPIPLERMPRSRPRRRPAPPPLASETAARGLGPPAGAAPPAPLQPGQLPPAPAGGNFGRLPADLIPEALVWSPSSGGGADPAILESPILKDGVKGKAFYFDDTNRGILGTDVGFFERTQPFSFDLWVMAAQIYEDSALINHREEDWSGNAGYALDIEQNRLRFAIMHSRAGNTIRMITMQAVPVKQWTHVTVTYDGSSRAGGVVTYINGVKADVDVISDNLTRTILTNGGGTLGGEYLGMQFGKRFRMTTMKDGAIDEVRVFRKTLTPLEVRYLHDETLAGVDREAMRREMVEFIAAGDVQVVEATAKLQQVREAQNQMISVIPEVPVMREAQRKRHTYLLNRGLYSDHGDEVPPQGLSQIFPYDGSLPKDRLGLARWLFDPKHPLTSRVFVNRMWQLHFGRGLVETSEDFGSQGSIPSHPELLDWLAVTFRESGWDTKKLHKQIVMSATYRQSSVTTDDLLKKDPRNLLLARYPRLRLPAEMVRDGALAASGLLTKAVGGRTVYPYQPTGIWDGLSGYNYPSADQIPQDDHHRRTLYTFIKRNAPHPAMATFDMPDRGTSTVRRQVSNTPLQALVLLNDPQYLEAYRVLATGVMKVVATRDARITRVFRLATRRSPRPGELASMRAYYDAQLDEYSADRGAARDLVTVGVSPVDAQMDLAELAALTNLTAAVMNTPDAYMLR